MADRRAGELRVREAGAEVQVSDEMRQLSEDIYEAWRQASTPRARIAAIIDGIKDCVERGHYCYLRRYVS